MHAGARVLAFECLFGFPMATPLDVALGSLHDNKVQAAGEVIEARALVHRHVHEQLEKYNRQMQASANKRRRDVSFEVGDLVHVSTSNLKLPAGLTRKLTPLFVGPFRVLERIGAVSYRVELPSDFGAIHNVFHVSLLKAHAGESPRQRPPMFVPDAH